MASHVAARACALAGLLAVAALAPAPVSRAAEGPPGWVVDKVRFEPTEPAAGPLSVDGMGAFRGAIEVVPAGGGLAVINDVGLEDYVKGIAEVPSSWPTEALRAQAIAARSYAVNAKESSAAHPWKAEGADICNTDTCQVYAGLAKEQAPDGDAWRAAVDDTAGQVLLYKGRPIFAEYSASNGGHSVAGGEPYLRAIDDPDDASTALGHWHWTAPLVALAPALEVAPPLVLSGVARDGGSAVVTVTGPDGGTSQTEVGADDFRARINSLPPPPDLPAPLPSDQYTVSTDGDSAVFDGGGWGHGVGMSQNGALVKAQRGMSADEILAAYYSGITPETLDADRLPASIRVELATGRGSVTVDPNRYLKAVSGSGAQLGGIETGGWRVVPADGGVRVIPPEGWQPLSLKTAVVDPPDASSPSPIVRYDLSAPAVVTVRYVTPAGLTGEVPAKLVDAGGAVAESLPPPASAGDYQVVIEAVGGPDDTVTVPLKVEVGGSSRVRIEGSAYGVPAATPDRSGWLAVAAVLFLVSAVGAFRVRRRLRS